MRILKGLDSFKYVLENKDITLYNKDNQELFYDKDCDKLKIKLENNEEVSIILNDNTLETKWYTEKKRKAAFMIYIDNKLKNIEESFVFNISSEIKEMTSKVTEKYKVDDNINIKVKCVWFE